MKFLISNVLILFLSFLLCEYLQGLMICHFYRNFYQMAKCIAEEETTIEHYRWKYCSHSEFIQVLKINVVFIFSQKINNQYFKWHIHYFLTGDQPHRKRFCFWQQTWDGAQLRSAQANNFLSLDRQGNFKFFQKRFCTIVLSWCNLGLCSSPNAMETSVTL